MKFKVGDKVRVRIWEDMEKEFGTDYDGDIKTTRYSFLKSMKNCCKRIVTIETVCGEFYKVKESEFIFTDEMLEKLPIGFLESGYFCKDRSGGIFIWLYGQMVPNNEILAEISFNDDLTSKSCTDCDIMEIRKPIPGLGYTIDELFENYDKMELVWKRESEVKDKAIEMLNDVISECEKTMEAAKTTMENARQTIRQIEEGDLDALL